MTTLKQWVLGGEILEQGAAHPSIAGLAASWAGVLATLADLQKQGEGLKAFGAGRTEHPTIIIASLVPALREHAELVAIVAEQLEARLK